MACAASWAPRPSAMCAVWAGACAGPSHEIAAPGTAIVAAAPVSAGGAHHFGGVLLGLWAHDRPFHGRPDAGAGAVVQRPERSAEDTVARPAQHRQLGSAHHSGMAGGRTSVGKFLA